MLKVTKAKVWASIVPARLLLLRAIGMAIKARNSWGRNASVSSPKLPGELTADLRWRSVL